MTLYVLYFIGAAVGVSSVLFANRLATGCWGCAPWSRYYTAKRNAK